jgi:predicted RNA-binding protein YlxR (DUF448 family)
METGTMQEHTHGAKRERSRICVGCQARVVIDEQNAMLRVVLGPSLSSNPPASNVRGAGKHGVAVDVAGSAFGRGAHVHANPACLAKACKGGFSRAFRCEVVADAARLAHDVAASMERRVEGLLLGARRAGILAFGEEAREAVQNGAPLVLVACDAGASAGRSVAEAMTEGRALAWRTKADLGALFARSEVALVAVRHEGVANEIRRARSLADSVAVATV